MKKIIKFLFIIISFFTFQACSNLGKIRELGILGGAATGALIEKANHDAGNIISGSIIGAFIGLIAGDKMQEKIAQQDYQYAELELIIALEYHKPGTTRHWNNKDSTLKGEITIIKDYKTRNKKYREFSSILSINNHTYKINGKALRMGFEHWKIISLTKNFQ